MMNLSETPTLRSSPGQRSITCMHSSMSIHVKMQIQRFWVLDKHEHVAQIQFRNLSDSLSDRKTRDRWMIAHIEIDAIKNQTSLAKGKKDLRVQ